MNNRCDFYYNGVFYEHEKDFFKAHVDFNNSEMSEFAFETMWRFLGKDLSLNFFNLNRHPLLTNAEVGSILQEVMLFTLRRFNEVMEKKEERV